MKKPTVKYVLCWGDLSKGAMRRVFRTYDARDRFFRKLMTSKTYVANSASYFLA